MVARHHFAVYRAVNHTAVILQHTNYRDLWKVFSKTGAAAIGKSRNPTSYFLVLTRIDPLYHNLKPNKQMNIYFKKKCTNNEIIMNPSSNKHTAGFMTVCQGWLLLLPWSLGSAESWDPSWLDWFETQTYESPINKKKWTAL